MITGRVHGWKAEMIQMSGRVFDGEFATQRAERLLCRNVREQFLTTGTIRPLAADGRNAWKGRAAKRANKARKGHCHVGQVAIQMKRPIDCRAFRCNRRSGVTDYESDDINLR